ncbi:MAG: AMP-binding protein, partial [Candidatus Omnitrophica bacterium]|nr:AMP-binding protein [Candidatus Omnitrophota bacterium]
MKNMIINNQYNIGHICTKQQCELGRADKIAMRLISSDMTHVDYSFMALETNSNKVANAFRTLDLSKGDIIFTILPKVPEQFFILLGALKLQLIVSPLFANFGEEAIVDRIGDARAKVLVTKKSFLKKVDNIRHRLPDLKYIIITDFDSHLTSDTLSYPLLMKGASVFFETPFTSPDCPSILHYTSGSTGKPKGVLHVHGAILTISRTTKTILDLKENDKYWCTADQGWITGTSYGMIGPWSCGITQIH